MNQNSMSVVYRSSLWAGLALLAGLSSSACGLPPEANSPSVLQQPLDAADSPFDEESCTGTPLTRTEFLAKFAAGTSEAKLGEFELFAHKRTCNILTGCSAWGPPTQPQTGGVKSQALGGTLSLGIDTGANLHVWVRDSSLQGNTGHYPSFIASGAATPSFPNGGNYRYEYLDQDYDCGRGHCIPVGSPHRLTESPYYVDDHSGYKWATFEIAAITKSCARIVSVATTDMTNQYALLVRY